MKKESTVKKVVFDLDTKKCVACGACVVACMDQNDTKVDLGEEPFRCIGTLEPPLTSENEITYISLGCLHCDDAPCITACPVGSLKKDERGLTVYDTSVCIGCHSCAMACPFGIPAFDADGKMKKCDGCTVRLENGLEPACVRVCPTGALTCTTEEEYVAGKRSHSLREIAQKLREE